MALPLHPGSVDSQQIYLETYKLNPDKEEAAE